jgi:hypothetical protein
MQAIERAAKATIDSCICIETAKAEKQVPWLLAKVLSASAPASIETGDDAAARGAAQTAVGLDAAKAGELALLVQLYEPIDAGSSTYTLSKEKVHKIRSDQIRYKD